MLNTVKIGLGAQGLVIGGTSLWGVWKSAEIIMAPSSQEKMVEAVAFVTSTILFLLATLSITTIITLLILAPQLWYAAFKSGSTITKVIQNLKLAHSQDTLSIQNPNPPKRRNKI